VAGWLFKLFYRFVQISRVALDTDGGSPHYVHCPISTNILSMDTIIPKL